MAAPQPLHIFQKDVRHLWPETLVTLLLFVAFAWAVPFGWTQSEFSGLIPLLTGLLKFLMPVAWLVVISRLIHDEPLVGDRQFWTSRPYHWASLLAAKALYLLVFIYLPFFLMQVYLLKHAGLYPTTAIPALLHNLLLLTVFFIVPLAALAAVTSTFPRLLLSTIGAILYVLVVAGLFGYLVFQRMPPPHFLTLIEVLVTVLPLLALVYQYSTRKTNISRGLLVATPLLVIVFLLILPAGALIRHAYPESSASDDPKLIAVPLPATGATQPLRIFHGSVILNLPFKVDFVGAKSNYTVEGIEAKLTNSPDNWTSPFLTSVGTVINGAMPYTVMHVLMPETVFNKVHTSPSDLHLTLAVDHLKLGDPTTWKATLLPFSVPGHGVCTYSSEDPDASPTCRFPLKAPESVFVTGNMTPGACGQPLGPLQPGRTTLGPTVSAVDFDPVITLPLQLATGDPNPQHRYRLCPGTTLTFLDAKSVGKSRIELDAKAVTLENYVTRTVDKKSQTEVPAEGPQ